MVDRSVGASDVRPEMASEAHGRYPMGSDRLDLASFVREYPVGAALAALGIGFIAALILMPRPRDKYDRLEHRLNKAMKDVVRIKKETEDELEELRAAAKSVRAEAHEEVKQAERKAQRRAAKAEEQLEEALAEDESGDEGGGGGGGEGSRSWVALAVSALGAQGVRLLARWLGRRLRTDRVGSPGSLEEANIGFDQEPVPGEYSYTPPI